MAYEKEYHQKYYQKNKAKKKAQANLYYAKNSEKVNERQSLRYRQRRELRAKVENDKETRKTFLRTRFRRMNGRHGIMVEGGIKFETPFTDFSKIGKASCEFTMNDLELWREICRNSYKKGFKTYLA